MHKNFYHGLIAFALMFPFTGYSAVLKGVKLPEKSQADGKTLKLNGVAVLQKTIFNVDIYVAGLYLESPSKTEAKILGSNQIKKVVLVFLRDVSAKRIIDDWKNAFDDSCGANCDNMKPQFDRFASVMTDVHRGQEVRFSFYPDKLAIASNGKTEVIEGREFAKTFLATFIGENPGAEKVKSGLLNKQPA